MDTQWWVLGFALAVTGLTISALVRPNALVRGNAAWSACSWFAGEFAPWLGAAAVVVLVLVATTTDALAGERGRLAALLILASACGLVAVASRVRRTRDELESALQDALGPAYRRDVPPARMPAIIDEIPRRQYLRPVPRRSAAVELIADVAYPGGHERNVLDVYRPAAGCREAPVLLQIHGGGWTRGHKRQQALPLVHHLASLGWVVVTPNYRLCPGTRMPGPLIDCKAAMAWIRGHVGAYGGDPSFIAVTGGGTGAHLATLLALSFAEPELQPGFEHVDTRPAACVPLHGIYDLADRKHRHPGRPARLRWLGENVLSCPLERDALAWDLASPIALLRQDAPPFFVLHGTHDALSPVGEAREFARELHRVSSDPVVYAELEGAQHGWDTLCSPRALHTVRAVTRFLEWCAARHRAQGSRLGNADRARS
ncbi:MAG TPA: alpha/beta hydrolase [Steroidobacteraceae bacterium]|jgi:acetyl esterase/lipase|nr:alpha/beta hydrolase [Steroidobacteraceae bacterium]